MEAKRFIDIALGAMLLALTFFPMLVIVTCIVVIDGHAPFFLQRRVGRGGVAFLIWKFRTMTVAEDNPGVDALSYEGDPRVTPLGALLRGLKLDELPQLVNVLRGEMSLVGPRAIVPRVLEEVFSDERDRNIRASVRPGITGPAQLTGCNHLNGERAEHRVLDLEYVTNTPSSALAVLARDAGILCDTLLFVLGCLRKAISERGVQSLKEATELR